MTEKLIRNPKCSYLFLFPFFSTVHAPQKETNCPTQISIYCSIYMYMPIHIMTLPQTAKDTTGINVLLSITPSCLFKGFLGNPYLTEWATYANRNHDSNRLSLQNITIY